MNIVLFQPNTDGSEGFESFMDALYSTRLPFLASDLLKEGFAPADIAKALRRATTICRTSGIDLREHFKPVYTHYRDGLVKDCKLSRLAYGLVLLNSRPDQGATASWQLNLLSQVLQEPV